MISKEQIAEWKREAQPLVSQNRVYTHSHDQRILALINAYEVLAHDKSCPMCGGTCDARIEGIAEPYHGAIMECLDKQCGHKWLPRHSEYCVDLKIKIEKQSQALSVAKEALDSILDLISKGRMVRDTSRDHESDWMERAADLILKIKAVETALNEIKSLEANPNNPGEE